METMNLVRKDEHLTNIETRMGLHSPATTDVIKRSDFPDGPAGDDAYCEACARRDLSLEKDPRLVELKRKYGIKLEAEREAERREQEKKAYATARENARLSMTERNAVSEQALALANEDLKSGRITPQGFDDARQRHYKHLEEKALDSQAAGTFFNEWARDEIARNRVSGNA